MHFYLTKQVGGVLPVDHHTGYVVIGEYILNHLRPVQLIRAEYFHPIVCHVDAIDASCV